MKNTSDIPYIPNHVGIIPDGSRRWARKNGASLIDAYKITMVKIALSIDYFFSIGSKSISIYLLSKENLLRSKEELEKVIIAEEYFIKELLPEVIVNWNSRIKFCGDRHTAPDKLVEGFEYLTSNSKITAQDRMLYLLIAYSPLEEICSIQQQNSILLPSSFIEHLWVPEQIDLVLRTSGEHRLSNFLPIQSGYAEFYFLDKYFPDITENDLYKVINDYKYSRTRRLGR